MGVFMFGMKMRLDKYFRFARNKLGNNQGGFVEVLFKRRSVFGKLGNNLVENFALFQGC